MIDSTMFVIVVCVAGAAAHADDSALAGVRKTLDAMTSAVRAADGKAYLAQVDPTDPVFLKEQENWAADLAKGGPKEFSITIAEEGFTSTPEAAEGRMTMIWTLPNKAKSSSVSYRVRFVPERARGGDAAGGRWLYAGEAWLTHSANHVTVMYLSENLEGTAKLISEILPELRAKVNEGFGFGPESALATRVQEVKLYTYMAHLQSSIYLSYTDSLGGWNEPGESIKMLARADSRRRGLERVLAHEYGHVCTFELGPKANTMAWWILEGVAELAAEGAAGGPRPDKIVAHWAARKELAEWSDIAAFDEKGRRLSQFVYPQGHHMVGYISDRFGRSKRIEWLTAMAQGKGLDEATRSALGVSFDELDRDWRVALTTADTN